MCLSKSKHTKQQLINRLKFTLVTGDQLTRMKKRFNYHPTLEDTMREAGILLQQLPISCLLSVVGCRWHSRVKSSLFLSAWIAGQLGCTWKVVFVPAVPWDEGKLQVDSLSSSQTHRVRALKSMRELDLSSGRHILAAAVAFRHITANSTRLYKRNIIMSGHLIYHHHYLRGINRTCRWIKCLLRIASWWMNDEQISINDNSEFDWRLTLERASRIYPCGSIKAELEELF